MQIDDFFHNGQAQAGVGSFAALQTPPDTPLESEEATRVSERLRSLQSTLH